MTLCHGSLYNCHKKELNRTAGLRNGFDVFAVYLRSNEINCLAYAAA